VKSKQSTSAPITAVVSLTNLFTVVNYERSKVTCIGGHYSLLLLLILLGVVIVSLLYKLHSENRLSVGYCFQCYIHFTVVIDDRKKISLYEYLHLYKVATRANCE
jgi:hypothetical protein